MRVSIAGDIPAPDSERYAEVLPRYLLRAIERTRGAWLRRHFEGRLWIGVERYLRGDHPWQVLARLAAHLGLPLVACAGALMHSAARQPLHDTLTAIRLGRPLEQCGYELQPSAERHLRPLATLRRLYPPALLEESVALATRCRFSLDELRYEYPREIVPA